MDVTSAAFFVFVFHSSQAYSVYHLVGTRAEIDLSICQFECAMIQLIALYEYISFVDVVTIQCFLITCTLHSCLTATLRCILLIKCEQRSFQAIQFLWFPREKLRCLTTACVRIFVLQLFWPLTKHRQTQTQIQFNSILVYNNY